MTLTKAQIQEILSTEEFSINQFASKFGVSVAEIQQLLKEYDNDEIRRQHKVAKGGQNDEGTNV